MGTAASSVEAGGGDLEDEKTTLPSIYNNTLSEDQFRLLTLLPGRKNAKIECHIDCYILSTCPAYTALSHRWDQSPASIATRLNCEQFFLGENLWNCFHSIRRRDKAIVLWVDSICINQNNMLERNHQVSLMGQVYSMATDVFVWLGRHADNSEVAMACLKDLEIKGLNGKPMILKEDTIFRRPLEERLLESGLDYSRNPTGQKNLDLVWGRLCILEFFNLHHHTCKRLARIV
jgi:hypothetical protein